MYTSLTKLKKEERELPTRVIFRKTKKIVCNYTIYQKTMIPTTDRGRDKLFCIFRKLCTARDYLVIKSAIIV